ncbi:hypothetical protein GCM10011608_09500 [Micromonospora sonchi]|uniref:Uncharacterized protein n=1 Tax=Micromonospora sonchi TaxID=1763543 RepID=A0A917TKT5_9ACTN|nr:hypothetical protein [Micromonospora sonchi]GGM26838.1 hypothetical protein GCM10011608_09500 [Micromonospora sonchi]
MTTLTIVRGGAIRRPARPHTSKCDQHPRYTAGCPACQQRGRIRQAAREKAAILGALTDYYVPAIGTARRLQGLTYAGHSAPTLARHLGISINPVKEWRAHCTQLITRRTHHTIARLAAQLEATPGTCRKARTYAIQQGWVPLAAWDDIDDPDGWPVEGSLTGPIPERPVSLRYVGWALDGDMPVGRLTAAEQAHLYRVWCDREQAAGRVAGRKPFAREFGITEWQARQIAAQAAQLDINPNHAATGRTNERTAA